MSWILNRGLNLGKQIFIAGFVASSAPVVVPPLVIVSAIGLAVSVPYGLFLASHACTEKLMSKLLPRSSSPQLFWGPYIEGGEKENGQLQKEVCFEGDINIDVEEEELQKETKREIEMGMEIGDVENMKEKENNLLLGDDYGQGEVKKGELEISQDVPNVMENSVSKGGNSDCTREKEKALAGKPTDVKLETNREAEVEEIWTRETKEDEPMIMGQRVIAPNGLVENVEVPWLDKHGYTLMGIEREGRKEYPKVSEEIVVSKHTENMDPVEIAAGSDEPVSVMLEDIDVNDGKDSERQMEEPCGPHNEVIVIERRDCYILVGESSSEVGSEKTDSHLNVSLLEERLDNNISDNVNQDSEILGCIEILDSSDADAREIADESGFDLFDEKCIDFQEYSYTVDLHEESNTMANDHTDPMELPVLSVDKYRQSEYSSGDDIISSSNEVNLKEEKMWKQIHAMRVIVGYEGTPQASLIDELKALYIFTGVEPPTSVKNSCEPDEISDKLHFLMAIIGVKSNMA